MFGFGFDPLSPGHALWLHVYGTAAELDTVFLREPVTDLHGVDGYLEPDFSPQMCYSSVQTVQGTSQGSHTEVALFTKADGQLTVGYSLKCCELTHICL